MRINSINEGRKEIEGTQINGRYKDPMDYDPTFFPTIPLVYTKTCRIVSGTQVSHGRSWTEPAVQHKHVTKGRWRPPCD